MKTLLQTLFFFLLVTQICFGQWEDETNIPKQIDNFLPEKPHNPTHTPGRAPVSLHPSFYDRKADWQLIIDSTWGSGESLSGKFTTFDLYQEYARAYNSTFQWNPINWDSLAASLRSQINDSTSRGGFATILKELSLGMIDGHAYAYDNVILNTPLNPGVPILADGGGFINHFGAGLTPLADSSLLVYKVVPNHPLGLVPGDIILGYEGVPWSQIVRELLAGNVPNTLWIGGSQSSSNRVLLWAAGESWHMFDTIDVVKYATGLTEHLPLDPMVNLVTPSNYINNEQLPVPGVTMPVFNQNSGAVTYGIIQGTNIGYIYVYHEGYAAVSMEFDEAVLALMQTDGLIIDIRFNWGGRYGLNAGISRLMNHSTLTMDVKKRCSPLDLYSLCPYSPSFWVGEIPADIGTFYDKPIAVLLGPNCMSYGDISSWQLSYIPNAKMFGRSPMAIYSGMWSSLAPQPSRTGYSLQCTNLTLVDHYEPEIPRWGQEYPSFEEVWLTPDGVANGEDDVVNRAVEWMNNLVYPHNTITDLKSYSPVQDTVHFSTIIENPNSHQISARGYIYNLDDVLIDSIDFTQQGFVSDQEYWTADFELPLPEEFYKADVTAFDQTSSTSFTFSDVTSFTTVGPVVLDSISWTKISTYYYVKPFLENQSTATTITNASVRLICNDPWVTSIIPTTKDLPDIPPGSIVAPTTMFIVNVDTTIFPDYFNFKVEVMSDGWPYWTDSMQVETTFQLLVLIANGWNMVSIPGFHPVNQNVLTWWTYKDPSAEVFRYGSLGYYVVSSATPGEGYWMKHLGDREYNTGDEWPASGIQIVTHNSIPGIQGWNMIGGYENSVATAGITTTPPGLITGPIYKYSTGYQIATTLDPGYGYWIKLTGAGQIIIPEALAKSGEEIEYFSEDWGRITITDAAGISYTLYAVKKGVDLNQYELPPAAPSGMFDIRFGSGRIAEDLSSTLQTIEMSGIEYPLTVRVENMDIRLQDQTEKLININLKSGEDIVISDATITKLMVSGELIPAVYALEQNYPNPFNPSTTIEFSLPENVNNVKLSIYNVLGEKVAELVNTALVAGKYSYQWNAQNVATGMYIYELRTDKFVSIKKMLLLK